MTSYKIDDWTNSLSSLGSIRDKATGISFGRRNRLSREVLDTMYEQNPIVARVVDRLPDDALRNGWSLTGTDVDIDLAEVQSKLDDLGVDAALARAVRWSRLYGGSLLVIPAVDTGTPADQLNLQGMQALYAPTVVPAHEAVPFDMDATFGSPTYRKVLNYDITGLNGRQIRVHHSRCVPFEPIELPYEALLKSTTGWGPSVVDRLFDDISKEGSARAHANSLIYNASLLYLQMEGFRSAHATADGREAIQTLLLKTRQGLDTLGILGLDSADKIGNITTSMSGVTEIIDRARQALAAASDMPKEILFNESPAGLNAGQLSGPQELWFAHVSAFQERVLSPALDRILEICFAAWKIPAKEWRIEWAPLWTKSEGEQAVTNLAQAQADQIYYTIGSLSAAEIREHRHEHGLPGHIEVKDEVVTPLELDIGAYEQAAGATTAPAEVSDTPTPADTAMNGAQIEGLIGIVEKVKAGLIPRDSGAQIIGAAYPQLAQRAEAILGSAGMSIPAEAAPVPGAVDEAGAEVQAAYEPPDGETPMTSADLAVATGFSANSIRGLHRRGEIGGWQIGGRWRYLKSEILQKAHRPAAGANDVDGE